MQIQSIAGYPACQKPGRSNFLSWIMSKEEPNAEMEE